MKRCITSNTYQWFKEKKKFSQLGRKRVHKVRLAFKTFLPILISVLLPDGGNTFFFFFGKLSES